MANASPSLSTVPNRMPSQVPRPTLAAWPNLLAVPKLAQQRAHERPHEQADRPEEQPGQRADHRADEGLAAGTHALGAQHGGEEVDRHREQGHQAQHHQRKPADLLEIAGPCRQQHAGEHQRQAGQGRQNHPADADQDQDHRQRVVKELHFQEFLP